MDKTKTVKPARFSVTAYVTGDTKKELEAQSPLVKRSARAAFVLDSWADQQRKARARS